MIRWIWTVFIVGLITVLMGELALRIYNPIYVPIRADQIQLPINRTFKQVNLNNKDVDRERVNSYNSIGLRGPEFPLNANEYTKIFTVGGSTTACVTLTDGKTWPDLVLKQLHQRLGGNIWLNNAGMDGHSTFGHRILLASHLAKYRPNYMVSRRDDLNGYDSGLMLQGQSLRNRVIATSELLSTAQTLYRGYRAHDMGLNHAVDHDLKTIQKIQMTAEDTSIYLREHRERHAPAYERRLRDLVERTISYGAVPVLVTQPAMFGRGVDPASGIVFDDLTYDIPGLSSSVVWDALEMYNDVTRGIAAEFRVPIVDAAKEMPKDSSLYFDWIHYSNKGAVKMADIVSGELSRIIATR